MAEERRNVYLNFHKSFVRENIPYTDRETGEQKTYNQVTLPKGTVVDGHDVGGWRFSPLFVNPSRYKGDDWRDIPVLADKELWLSHTRMDEGGEPVLDDSGRPVRDTLKVSPRALKDSMDAARKQYAESKGLDDRAHDARQTSAALSGRAPSRDDLAREDIPF